MRGGSESLGLCLASHWRSDHLKNDDQQLLLQIGQVAPDHESKSFVRRTCLTTGLLALMLFFSAEGLKINITVSSFRAFDENRSGSAKRALCYCPRGQSR
jgi:hypothetical protein